MAATLDSLFSPDKESTCTLVLGGTTPGADAEGSPTPASGVGSVDISVAGSTPVLTPGDKNELEERAREPTEEKAEGRLEAEFAPAEESKEEEPRQDSLQEEAPQADRPAQAETASSTMASVAGEPDRETRAEGAVAGEESSTAVSTETTEQPGDAQSSPAAALEAAEQVVESVLESQSASNSELVSAKDQSPSCPTPPQQEKEEVTAAIKPEVSQTADVVVKEKLEQQAQDAEANAEESQCQQGPNATEETSEKWDPGPKLFEVSINGVPTVIFENTKLEFKSDNPKRFGTKAFAHYELYKVAKTGGEFLKMQSDRQRKEIIVDFKHDASRGFLKILQTAVPSSSSATKTGKSSVAEKGPSQAKKPDNTAKKAESKVKESKHDKETKGNKDKPQKKDKREETRPSKRDKKEQSPQEKVRRKHSLWWCEECQTAQPSASAHGKATGHAKFRAMDEVERQKYWEEHPEVLVATTEAFLKKKATKAEKKKKKHKKADKVDKAEKAEKESSKADTKGKKRPNLPRLGGLKRKTVPKYCEECKEVKANPELHTRHSGHANFRMLTAEELEAHKASAPPKKAAKLQKFGPSIIARKASGSLSSPVKWPGSSAAEAPAAPNIADVPVIPAMSSGSASAAAASSTASTAVPAMLVPVIPALPKAVGTATATTLAASSGSPPSAKAPATKNGPINRKTKTKGKAKATAIQSGSKHTRQKDEKEDDDEEEENRLKRKHKTKTPVKPPSSSSSSSSSDSSSGSEATEEEQPLPPPAQAPSRESITEKDKASKEREKEKEEADPLQLVEADDAAALKSWEEKVKKILERGPEAADRMVAEVLKRARAGMRIGTGLQLYSCEEARMMLQRLGAGEALRKERERERLATEERQREELRKRQQEEQFQQHQQQQHFLQQQQQLPHQFYLQQLQHQQPMYPSHPSSSSTSRPGSLPSSLPGLPPGGGSPPSLDANQLAWARYLASAQLQLPPPAAANPAVTAAPAAPSAPPPLGSQVGLPDWMQQLSGGAPPPPSMPSSFPPSQPFSAGSQPSTAQLISWAISQGRFPPSAEELMAASSRYAAGAAAPPGMLPPGTQGFRTASAPTSVPPLPTPAARSSIGESWGNLAKAHALASTSGSTSAPSLPTGAHNNHNSSSPTLPMPLASYMPRGAPPPLSSSSSSSDALQQLQQQQQQQQVQDNASEPARRPQAAARKSGVPSVPPSLR